jgi:hypothetical protein
MMQVEDTSRANLTTHTLLDETIVDHVLFFLFVLVHVDP